MIENLRGLPPISRRKLFIGGGVFGAAVMINGLFSPEALAQGQFIDPFAKEIELGVTKKLITVSAQHDGSIRPTWKQGFSDPDNISKILARSTLVEVTKEALNLNVEYLLALEQFNDVVLQMNHGEYNKFAVRLAKPNPEFFIPSSQQTPEDYFHAWIALNNQIISHSIYKNTGEFGVRIILGKAS